MYVPNEQYILLYTTHFDVEQNEKIYIAFVGSRASAQSVQHDEGIAARRLTFILNETLHATCTFYIYMYSQLNFINNIHQIAERTVRARARRTKRGHKIDTLV